MSNEPVYEERAEEAVLELHEDSHSESGNGSEWNFSESDEDNNAPVAERPAIDSTNNGLPSKEELMDMVEILSKELKVECVQEAFDFHFQFLARNGDLERRQYEQESLLKELQMITEEKHETWENCNDQFTIGIRTLTKISEEYDKLKAEIKKTVDKQVQLYNSAISRLKKIVHETDTLKPPPEDKNVSVDEFGQFDDSPSSGADMESKNQQQPSAEDS